MSKSEGKNLTTSYNWFADSVVIEEFLFSVDEIARNLPNEVAILGVGSGVGSLDYAVKKRLEDKHGKLVKLTITDRYTSDTIKSDGVEVQNIDNKNIPFSEASFDLVIARSVTHYEKTEKDELGVLKQIYKVLKPNGYFITEAPYFKEQKEVELLKKIHALVAKVMNLKTYEELLKIHKVVFNTVELASKQPSVRLDTEKKNFNKRYSISDNSEINDEIVRLIGNYSSQETPNAWTQNNNYGWSVNFAILLCRKVG